MDRFPNPIIPPKGKRYVTYSSNYMGSGKVFTNPFSSFKEIQSITAMFIHTCSHWKDIWIQYYIRCRKTCLLCKQFISTIADLFSSFKSICLPLFIKRHTNNSSAEPSYYLGTP